MSESVAIRWKLKGTVLIACNCDYGCPCNFNALPSHGHCEGGWSWHIADGAFGDAQLNGLNFAIAADWPKAIHDGNGEAAVFIDERANENQRAAIRMLVSGAVGGPWAILKNTWTKVHEPRYLPFDVEVADRKSRATIGDVFRLELDPIKNPVTGVEATPSAILPQGFISKNIALAASKLFQVADGVHYDHSGKYAALGPFDYSGP